MQMASFQYRKDKGWQVDAFPSLDSDNTWVLVFSSPTFFNRPDIFELLFNAYPQAKMIGCSTAGEIFGDRIYDDSLSVAVIKFSETTLKLAKVSINSIADSEAAGIALGKQLVSKDLKNIFVLSDGLEINGSQLIKGLNASLNDEKIIITGGLAGDGDQFKKTWIICNGELHQKQVVAVGLYGNRLKVGHSSRGGWDIFGPTRRVTRSEANILYELDYQPALQLYKEYLGDKAAELPSSGLLYPLSITLQENPDTQLVRTILGVDESQQSLIFAGDIPVGSYAKLMRANFDRLIDSASEAAKIAQNMSHSSGIDVPLFAIDISCVGRRLLLGERTEEEVEATAESLPQDSIQMGFYSYGELSPFTSGRCELHNQTMTITTYAEISPLR